MQSRRSIFRVLAVAAVGLLAGMSASASPTVEVTLSRAAAEGIAALGLEVPVTGRVFVIISRNGDEELALTELFVLGGGNFDFFACVGKSS